MSLKAENAPPRKWKQNEALIAIEMLKSDNTYKWEKYLYEELNGEQISDEIVLWIMKTLAPIFDSDLREISGLFVKIRANINPKWEKYAGDDK